MKEAVSAATKLKTALGNAVDPNTGLLNLSKASNNLKALNIDLRKTSD
nr:MAG TPA: Protein mago nash-like protein [Caudoviricetes sp.]